MKLRYFYEFTGPEWMSVEEYKSFPEEILLERLKLKYQEKVLNLINVFATTFLNATDVNKNDLINLYNYRWCVEIDLKSIRDTMKMEILRGKTPTIIRKEIWMHILAYNLVRKIMAQSAYIHNKMPRELSLVWPFRLLMPFG